MDNISLAAGDYSFNEDFEDYELNKTVASDVWVLSCAQSWAVDIDTANVRVQDASYATRAPQLSNKALNINHTYMHSTAINSVYAINSTSKATLSFDYLYDGISPHNNGAKGGARLGFSADGTFTYGLYVSKLDESWTEDVADYDKNAKLSYYDGSKYVDTGFNALTKGEWYNFTLELNGAKATVTVKQNAKILFTATYDNAVAKAVNQIYLANRGWDSKDIHWVDNLDFVSDSQTYSNDFDSLAEGVIPDGWTNSATNTSTVFVKAALKPLPLVDLNNALLVQDSSEKLGPVRATRSFDEADGVTVEFDYMLASDGLFEANYFNIYSKAETTDAGKILVGVFPNTDLDGNYTGTATLKYYNGSGWFATTKNDVTPGEWYRIKIEIEPGETTARLYLDGSKLADVWARSSIPTVDRFSVESGSVEGKGDLFYIDNLNVTTIITEKAKEFSDDLSSATAIPDTYTAEGNVALNNGEITLSGEGSVVRNLSVGAYSGDFSFTLKTDSLDKTAQIILTENGEERFVFRVREDGALEFKRPSHYGDTWRLINTILTDDNGNKYPKGQIKENESAYITIRLPYDRNSAYVYIYVDGELVGDGLLYSDFDYIDGFGVSSLGAETTVSIKDVSYSFDTEGVIKMPEREEEAPTSYLPVVIEGSKAMYLENDTAPLSGAMSYADASTSVQFNKKNNSIGVDLGVKQKINALRISTEAASEDIIKSSDVRHFIAYQSDDNITYTAVKGITYNHLYENGKWVALIEFSGVEARYIKIHYQETVGEGNPIEVKPLGNIRPEAQIARQYKLAGNFVIVPNTDRDPLHTSLAREFNTRTSLELVTGMSIGFDFGTHTDVEAIELVGSGLADLDANAFEVYVSDDNCYYKKIDNVVLSRDTKDGKDVYRLSFDSVNCVQIKLYAKADGINVTLDSVKDDFAAYSSVEADSYYYRYHYWRGGEGCFFTLPDGTVIMAFIGATDGTHDYSTYKMLAVASLDGGYTWGEPWMFLDMPTNALSVSSGKVIYLDDKQETLGLVYRVIYEREDGNGYLADVFFTRSYDLGKNWEDPIKLVTDIYPDTYGGGTSGNSITRLSNGRILYSYTAREYQHDDWGHPSNTHFREYINAVVFYSDDEGYTWTRADNSVILPQNADETSIAELDNGQLLLTMRTRDENAVYQSISTDNGVTWAQPVAVDGIDTPSSTNTIVTIPSTGDVMLVWNNQPYDPANGNGTRNPLTAAITADHGLTYGNVRNIFEYDDSSWANIHFYGRKVFISNGGMTFIRIHDVAQFYHTVSGVKTVADLPKATTPAASYDGETGWLTGVSSDMTYSLDGGRTWKFCGGTSVLIGKYVDEILVKDIGTDKTAPSDIQTISEPLLTASAETLSDGSYLYLDENHVMHNKTLKLTFDANQLADGAVIKLGHGETAYGGSTVELTNKTVGAYNYLIGKNQTLIATEHGLDISGTVEVTVRTSFRTASVSIKANGETFISKNFEWFGRNGKIYAKSEGAALENLSVEWGSSEYRKDIWLMGDSYFSTVNEARWPYYLLEDGYTDYFMMGFPGRDSVSALADFKKALEFGTPKYAVWCMGMNDRDSETAVNANWLSCYNEFISICNEKGITPILATIPNTPATSDDPGRIHTFKNDIIRKSGYRYIDFATAVDANEVGSGWTEGMLSADTVHPSAEGAKALYAQVLKDFPEISMRVTKTRLRVATWNVGDFTGKGMTLGSDASKQAYTAVMQKADVDLWGLQEDVRYFVVETSTTPYTAIYKNVQPYYERNFTGSPTANLTYNGKAFLSEFEITDVKAINYPEPVLTLGDTKTYGHPWFLTGKINVDGKEISVVTLHFDWSCKERRAAQIGAVIDFAKEQEYCIILGDFNPEDYVGDDNAENDARKLSNNLLYEEELARFEAVGFEAANAGRFGVFNTLVNSTGPWDNILVSRNINILSVETITEPWMNDHAIVVADIAIG